MKAILAAAVLLFLAEQRVILIVLDDYHVALNAGRIFVSKLIARRLVERLGPSDHAAVIGTSSRSVAPVEFTADKARLLDAIDRFVPQSEQGTGLVGDPSGTGVANPFDVQRIQALLRQVDAARLDVGVGGAAADSRPKVIHRRTAILQGIYMPGACRGNARQAGDRCGPRITLPLAYDAVRSLPAGRVRMSVRPRTDDSHR